MPKKIVVGSKNPVKIGAVKTVFADYEVIGENVPSGVSAQPLSDEETIKGAVNRALGSLRYGDIGIGLEGGVSQTSYGLLVISYGALIDEKHQVYLAGGTRILLPSEVAKEVYKGAELGDVMDAYAKKRDVRHDEGAVGIFTGNLIKRQEMFEHIVKLLYGQMLTGKNAVNYKI